MDILILSLLQYPNNVELQLQSVRARMHYEKIPQVACNTPKRHVDMIGPMKGRFREKPLTLLKTFRLLSYIVYRFRGQNVQLIFHTKKYKRINLIKGISIVFVR